MKKLHMNIVDDIRLVIKHIRKLSMAMILMITFGSGQPVFTEHVISNTVNGAWFVHAQDMDTDGDMDVLSASFSDDIIAWYKNDGNENFTTYSISTSASGARSVYAADVDSDGHMDALSASYSDNKISWYQNDGNENFTEYVISNTANGAYSVHAADVDGDGDIDVLSASYYDNKIAWYQNDGNENFTTYVISLSAEGARSIYVADVNSDGDMDVLSASLSDNKISWYENDGNENFTDHVISSTVNGAWSVHAADLDGNGKMDVLAASFYDNEIIWYENDGNENFTTYVISTSADGARSVYAADVDGDNDVDVLSASLSDNKIAWYKNQREALTGFVLYPQGTYVSLTWDPISDDDFQYYVVERSTDSVFTENVVSNELVINFYEDDSLEYDTEYFYRVYYSTEVHQSNYSEVISVTLEWMDVNIGYLPIVYRLHQNYPNPFNPLTAIKYDLPQATDMNISIYDMMGRQVRNLVNTNQNSGYKSVVWNGTNDNGEMVSGGMYFYSIKTNTFSQTRKMILLK